METNLKFIIITFFFPLVLIGQSRGYEIEKIVNDYLPPNGPGVAIIATQNQKKLYENAFGLSNISNGEKVQADDLFRIGSITKQFTAAAILKLAHEDRLRLEDPIEKYIPNATMAENISIKQLLQHTSGLGNQSDVAAFKVDSIDLNNYPENIIQPILDSPSKFSPGTDYAYSNLGYIILGYIIERVTDMPYEIYLKIAFFQPLGMNYTGFEYIDDNILSNSKGYSLVNGKFEEAVPLNMKIAYSAGGLVSSLQDLDKWNRAVMAGKVLPSSYVGRIQETSTLPNGKATGYSLGWQIGNIQGLKTVRHDGIVNGFTSMAIYVPEADIFVTTLSNCDCFRDIELLASRITALLADRPFPTQSIKLSKDELEKFQGKYNHDNSEMILAAHDSTLMYYRSGGEKKTLIPVDPNSFGIEGTLDQIRFSKGDKSSYTLRSLSGNTHWERTEIVTAYNFLLLDDKKLEEYVGKYRVPNAFVFDVIKVGDKLYGQIGNDRKEILCYDTDKFCARYTDALLQFSRDQEGKVVKLILTFDRAFTAERME
ncbi:serine hydrolase [Flavobacteriaceae bacterium F89]|uniref:Serine hydrolase n=1 Tax=Cerina litoralis TaxID=2874477 RepID=A0AAE3ER83_9FLAO|nr:serine hydrolase [Cerina litoralis]MCG2459627.1 serine hydrolase [Cerina litoralis]